MKVQEKLKNMLIEAGLSEVEIVIYFELLKKPSETKWNLINRTGLDRNCVYRAFEKLEQLKMVKKDREGIKALSLKPFVDGLLHSEKRLGKLADKIRKTAPFLRVPTEAVEEFDVVHFQDQILDNYMMMSKVKYNTCLDFGDLENFVPVLGGMEPVLKFRENRYKQSAKNKAICTTFGPYTSCMARKNDAEKFQSIISLMPTEFKGKWIIFSDTNNYVMFNDFSDPEFTSSVLVKSKTISESQRMLFDQFSQNFEKI